MRQVREHIGIVDTTFMRVGMAAVAERRLAAVDGYGKRFVVLTRPFHA